MTVAELESRMTSAEFTDWIQFFEWRTAMRDPSITPQGG